MANLDYSLGMFGSLGALAQGLTQGILAGNQLAERHERTEAYRMQNALALLLGAGKLADTQPEIAQAMFQAAGKFGLPISMPAIGSSYPWEGKIKKAEGVADALTKRFGGKMTEHRDDLVLNLLGLKTLKDEQAKATAEMIMIGSALGFNKNPAKWNKDQWGQVYQGLVGLQGEKQAARTQAVVDIRGLGGAGGSEKTPQSYVDMQGKYIGEFSPGTAPQGTMRASTYTALNPQTSATPLGPLDTEALLGQMNTVNQELASGKLDPVKRELLSRQGWTFQQQEVPVSGTLNKFSLGVFGQPAGTQMLETAIPPGVKTTTRTRPGAAPPIPALAHPPPPGFQVLP